MTQSVRPVVRSMSDIEAAEIERSHDASIQVLIDTAE